MGGGPSAEESQYWSERRQREAKADYARMKTEQKTAQVNKEFWKGVEQQSSNAWDFLVNVFWLAVFVAVGVGLMWLLQLFYKRESEKEQLKHQLEMQKQKIEHEARSKESELKQQSSLKEQELQQQLLLRGKELDQQAMLQEKKLEQDRYNAERDYRLQMGKMVFDVQQEAMRTGNLATFNSSLTNITQNVLMADQSASSVGNIGELSRMAITEDSNVRLRRSGARREHRTEASASWRSFHEDSSEAHSFEFADNMIEAVESSDGDHNE